MADEYFWRKMIFVRHGKGVRQYPFSFVELRDNNHNVIGSGMSPDGEMVRNVEPMPITDLEGIPQTSENMVIDPAFFKTNELATGVMYNRFQW